jgi:hypothetical protein
VRVVVWRFCFSAIVTSVPLRVDVKIARSKQSEVHPKFLPPQVLIMRAYSS